MPEKFAVPDRIAVDADGFGWRVWDDEPYWSMVPSNPDNEPVPEPVTWFVREERLEDLRALLRLWEERVACLQCGRRYSETACGPTHALVAREVRGRPDNGFVCNRIGGGHRLGTTDCGACAPGGGKDA